MLELETDRAQLEKLQREITTKILRAGTGSVHDATRRLEREFEALTRAVVPGRAWRAWKSNVYPRGGGPAYEPVGEVFGNGDKRTWGMLSYWTQPGVNRAKGGEYLAVPLKAALGTSLGRHISPQQWEARFNAKLRPWFRPGKTPLLVADGAIGGGGFVPAESAGAKIRGGQNLRVGRSIPVFALIAEQRHANRVSLEPSLRRANAYMQESFGRRVARIARG